MSSHPVEPPPGEPGAGTTESAPQVPGDKVLPASSTSGDELTERLIHGDPDPLLDPAPGHEATRADALNALAGLNVSPTDTPAVPQEGSFSVVSAEALAGIDLGARSARRAHKPRVRHRATEPGSDDGEDDEHPPRGSSWGTMLLASYASAVTLGLIWVLWTGRRVREEVVPEAPPPADTRADPGARAGTARKVVPPAPIPAGHVATLGQTVRLGRIEATPVVIASGKVYLERNFAKRERKSGGGGALFLRLRLRNVSSDTVLAPFDEAFVRNRVGADPDSFIQADDEPGPAVPMYPLAVESEWSIAGQEFRELRPGEAFETLAVSAPGAAGRLAPEMTWRIRLRTDINHTDDLGVRFRADDVVPIETSDRLPD